MSNELNALLQKEAEIREQMAEYNLATADLRVQIKINQREVCRLSQELMKVRKQCADMAESEGL